jgi:hypothetical protein
MTLRDYFAAQAMAAIISKAPYLTHAEDDPRVAIETAGGAYAYADAMLAERETAA